MKLSIRKIKQKEIYWYYKILVALIIIINIGTKESVCSEDSNTNNRSFYIQSKIKHDYPTSTAIYGGSEINSSKSLALELLHGSKEKVSVGMGIEYQYPRKYKNISHRSKKISFLPIYIKWQYVFDICENYNIYVGGQYGYNFLFFNDLYNKEYESKGGSHFGIILGNIIHKNFLLESSLTYNSGELINKENDNKTGIRCFTLSLGFGIRFD